MISNMYLSNQVFDHSRIWQTNYLTNKNGIQNEQID